jgi:hypothetical protein
MLPDAEAETPMPPSTLGGFIGNTGDAVRLARLDHQAGVRQEDERRRGAHQQPELFDDRVRIGPGERVLEDDDTRAIDQRLLGTEHLRLARPRRTPLEPQRREERAAHGRIVLDDDDLGGEEHGGNGVAHEEDLLSAAKTKQTAGGFHSHGSPSQGPSFKYRSNPDRRSPLRVLNQAFTCVRGCRIPSNHGIR